MKSCDPFSELKQERIVETTYHISRYREEIGGEGSEANGF